VLGGHAESRIARARRQLDDAPSSASQKTVAMGAGVPTWRQHRPPTPDS